MSILQPGGLLIVDPDRVRSARISQAFERQWGGATTARAGNAREAREKLLSDPPGLLLAHATLPSHEVRDLVRACVPRTRLFLLQNPEENPWPVSYPPGRHGPGCEVLTDDAEALPVQVELALFSETEPLACEPRPDEGGSFDFHDDTDEEHSGRGPEDGGSEERYATAWDLQRKLLERLPVACCVFGPDGELVYVNPAWVGGAEQPALGDCRTEESPYQQALEEGRACVPMAGPSRLVFERFEVPGTDKVGVSAQIAPGDGEEEPGAQAAQEEDGISVYDWTWNLAVERFELHPEWIHRLELSEPPERVSGFEACIEPADLPRVRRTIRDHLARGSRSFVVRFSLRTTMGHVLPCESQGQLLRRSPGGEPELLGGRLRPLAMGWESTRVPPETGSGDLPVAGNPTWSGARHILFCDPEPSILRLARAQLSRLGYAATTCSSAAEARAHMESGSFDVVVADERLVVAGGSELLGDRNGRGRVPGLVLTSGFKGSEGGSWAGVAGVLEKPYDLEDLARVLVRGLALSSASRCELE